MAFADLVLIDHASGLAPGDLRKFSYALGDQLRDHVAPVWGRYVVPWVGAPSGTFAPRTWKLHFWSTPRAAQEKGAYGYHTTDGPDHVPVGHVFTELIRRAGEEWTVIASHEALEMVADEWVNLEVTRKGPDGTWEIYPREIADPVQGLSYEITGVKVSDFVYPEWFIPGSDGPFDHMRRLSKPFEIHASGYAAVRRINGGRITTRNVYGAAYPSWRKKKRAMSRKSRRV